MYYETTQSRRNIEYAGNSEPKQSENRIICCFSSWGSFKYKSNKVYTNLKCVVKYAVKKKLLSENIMEDIDKPVAKKYVEDKNKALTYEEVSMIINSLSNKPMFQTMITIMAYTGIRPGEAYALKFSDFDYDKKTVTIKRTLSERKNADVKMKKTSGAEPLIKMLKNERGSKQEYARRLLKLSDNVLGLVKRWEESIKSNPTLVLKREANGTAEYLFTKPTDGKLGLPFYYGDEYKKELKRHGVDGSYYNMYRFRHTLCTSLFKEYNKDPKTVQLTMGDNSMDMVMRVYNSVDKSDVLAASGAYSNGLDTVLWR